MSKTVLASLLGAALLSAPALAQSTAPTTPAPAPTATAPAAGANANGAAFQVRQGQWRSSKLVGLNVYNNNDEKVGDINEIVVGRDGRVESVVIGVGGFLGMGEHDVAVPFTQVTFVEEPRGTTAAAARNTAGTNPPAAGTAAPAPTPVAPNPPTNVPATTARSDTYRGYPDHAMVNMTKDQLKALPEVRYAR